MKRLIVLTILVTTAISTTGCRRGFRACGLRGARCGAPVAPTYSPVPTYPATACPPAYPSAPGYDVCPTVPYSSGYGGTISGGTISGGVINGGVIDGSGGYFSSPSTVIEGSDAAFQVPAIEGLPMPSTMNSSSLNRSGAPFGLRGGHPGIHLSKQIVPNKPIFSHVIGDRKLEPGETINREYELPVKSAAATANEKK